MITRNYISGMPPSMMRKLLKFYFGSFFTKMVWSDKLGEYVALVMPETDREKIRVFSTYWTIKFRNIQEF